MDKPLLHMTMAEHRLSQWMTRGLSLIVNGFYAVILGAALVNEDPPTPAGLWVLAGVAACVVASLAAWRWPRPGGLAMLLGAAGVAGAVLYSARATGLGTLASVIGLILYTVPVVLIGALFMADGWFVQQKAGSP